VVVSLAVFEIFSYK